MEINIYYYDERPAGIPLHPIKRGGHCKKSAGRKDERSMGKDLGETAALSERQKSLHCMENKKS